MIAESIWLGDNVSYKPINYSEIYDFYEDKKSRFKGNSDYFEIFLEAMKKHTKDTDIEERMKARFIKRINELKNGKE